MENIKYVLSNPNDTDGTLNLVRFPDINTETYCSKYIAIEKVKKLDLGFNDLADRIEITPKSSEKEIRLKSLHKFFLDKGKWTCGYSSKEMITCMKEQYYQEYSLHLVEQDLIQCVEEMFKDLNINKIDEENHEISIIIGHCIIKKEIVLMFYKK